MDEPSRLYPAGEPDYAVPPGATIREFLDELNMTQRQLAIRLDLSPKHVNQLVQGVVSLSPDVAQRLELVTGMPARMWNRLEADFQTAQQRIRHREDLLDLTDWVHEFPIKDLVKRGVLPAQPHDDITRVQQLLAFFGLAHVSTYREIYERPAVAFRTTEVFRIQAGAVAAWLRLGELAAHDIKCEPYDRHGLHSSLDSLRQLTVQPARVFVPLMRDICARHGVAVVFVPEVTGTRACGATRWLTSDKAMVLLSGRHRSDDQLWFTFFHELGHVLEHGKSDVWIEDERKSEDPREAEADQFARDLLIPPASAARLATLRRLTDIERFAAEIGVAPGIVVGRLQRQHQLGWHVGHRLKKPIDIADFADA